MSRLETTLEFTRWEMIEAGNYIQANVPGNDGIF
jgi:hypothetical protein